MVEKNLVCTAPSQPILLLLPLLIFLGGLYAQTAKPFETLDIGLQYVANTNRNEFHDYWEPRQGVAGLLVTPFYYGYAQAGVQILPYSGKGGGLPDFTNAFIYLGWGVKWSLASKLDWFNSLNIGNNLMVFAKAERQAITESELGIGFNSCLSYHVNKRWAVCISGFSEIIFTHKRIKLTFISAGLSYSVSTPRFLREFLE